MITAKRILIVDDEPYLRMLIRNLLEPRYRVSTAASGTEALNITGDPFDLVIIDVLMPGMSGFEVCRRVRARANTDVPIIMLTALDEADMRAKCAAAGASDLLCKPFHPDELLARVGGFIDN